VIIHVFITNPGTQSSSPKSTMYVRLGLGYCLMVPRNVNYEESPKPLLSMVGAG